MNRYSRCNVFTCEIPADERWSVPWSSWLQFCNETRGRRPLSPATSPHTSVESEQEPAAETPPGCPLTFRIHINAHFPDKHLKDWSWRCVKTYMGCWQPEGFGQLHTHPVFSHQKAGCYGLPAWSSAGEGSPLRLL